MASKTSASIALFLAVNILFFTLVSACEPSCPTTTPAVPKPKPSCPKDTLLNLGVCANVLQGLLHIKLGTPPVTPCCSVIAGLLDLEAAVCVCTALNANVLGIHLHVPLSLTLLLNVCKKQVPEGFVCA